MYQSHAIDTLYQPRKDKRTNKNQLVSCTKNGKAVPLQSTTITETLKKHGIIF